MADGTPPPERPASESLPEDPRLPRDYELRAPRIDHGDRPPSRSETRMAVRAALTLFGVATLLELVTLAGVRLSSDPDGNVPVFLPVGMLIFVGGLLAAVAVSIRLPRSSRATFWGLGVICIFASVILWGVTCALAGTPRIGG
jgi:hypothetical protein